MICKTTITPTTFKINENKNMCSEDDLRTRIFETFVVKFLACLPLLGFSNIKKCIIAYF